MAAMEGENSGAELKGLLNLNNIVLQPEAIENAFKNPDSSWTYQVRWKDIWLHESLCMNFTDLVEGYWTRQKSGVYMNARNEHSNSVPGLIRNDNTRRSLPMVEDNGLCDVVAMSQTAAGRIQKGIIRAESSVCKIDDVDIQVKPSIKQIILEVPISENISENFNEANNRRLFHQALDNQAMNALPVSDKKVNHTITIETSHEEGMGSTKRESLNKSTSAQNSTSKSTKNNAVICELCHKILSSKNSLREHRITVHYKNGKFACDQCSKRFTHQRALKVHKVMHTDERNYVCEECGSTHKRERELRLHIRDMHTNTNNFRCDVCFSLFKAKGQLKAHCFSEHETTVTNCIVCKHKLSTPFSIYTHCLKHSQLKEFKCELCAKEFKSRTSLNNHMNTHDPQRKPFRTCPKCQKQIFSRSHYYEHVQSHDRDTNEIVRFKCETCLITFQHTSSLKRHLLRHRPGGDLEHPKENPYLNMEESKLPALCCRTCRKLYTSTSGYYDHIKKCRDGAMMEEKCEFCHKTYSAKKTLNRHLRKYHADELAEENFTAAQTVYEHLEVPENDAESEDIAIQIIALAPAIEEEVQNLLVENNSELNLTEEALEMNTEVHDDQALRSLEETSMSTQTEDDHVVACYQEEEDGQVENQELFAAVNQEGIGHQE